MKINRYYINELNNKLTPHHQKKKNHYILTLKLTIKNSLFENLQRSNNPTHPKEYPDTTLN